MNLRSIWLVVAVLFQAAVFHAFAAPPNDNYASRTALSAGLPKTVNANNLAATLESGELTFGDGASVWWSFTIPQAGTYEIDTVGSSFDTTLAIFTADPSPAVFPSSLHELASNDDGDTDNTSSIKYYFSASQTIQIRVAGFESEMGNITLNLRLLPPGPPNDHFVNAYTLGNPPQSINATNVNATLESSEPAATASGGGSSVWWKWTANTSEPVVITTAGSGFDTILAVYTGNSLGALTSVAVNDDDGLGNVTSQVNFTPVVGETYRIAVHGFSGAQGSIVLGLFLANNNDFAGRLALNPASLPITTTFSSVSATLQSGEPSPFADAASIWWSFIPAVAGKYRINTTGSNFDTTLALYTANTSPATLTSLAELAKNNDAAPGEVTSALTLVLQSGVPIYIRVAGYSGQKGNVVLHLQLVPPNDDFADASTLGTAPQSLTSTNISASLESAEPNPTESWGSSVWWKWTATSSSAPVVISTEGSNFDTVLAVYTGNSIGALTLIAANDDVNLPSNRTSKVIFTPIAGTVYRIAVHGFNAEQGNIALNLKYLDLAQFADWDDFYFTYNPPEDRTFSADPEGDLFSNFFEFAFGLNPTLPSVAAEFQTSEVKRPPGASNDYLYLTFNQRTPASGVTYVVAVSDNLSVWDKSGVQVETVGSPTALGNGLEKVTVRVLIDSTLTTRKFIRVEASSP